MASAKLEMVLADLTRQFGEQKILTLKELGPVLGKTESALLTLRCRDRFPLPATMLGGKVTVSIYDVALLLAGELKMPKKKKKVSTRYRTLEEIKNTRGGEDSEKAKARAKIATRVRRSLYRAGKPIPWGCLIDPLA